MPKDTWYIVHDVWSVGVYDAKLGAGPVIQELDHSKSKIPLTSKNKRGAQKEAKKVWQKALEKNKRDVKACIASLKKKNPRAIVAIGNGLNQTIFSPQLVCDAGEINV